MQGLIGVNGTAVITARADGREDAIRWVGHHAFIVFAPASQCSFVVDSAVVVVACTQCNQRIGGGMFNQVVSTVAPAGG